MRDFNHKGIAITVRHTDGMFVVEPEEGLGNLQATSLVEIKKLIEEATKNRRQPTKAFMLEAGWQHGHRRAIVPVLVTSITKDVGSYRSDRYVAYVSRNGNRSKESLDHVYQDTPHNKKLAGLYLKALAAVAKAEKAAETFKKLLKPVEVPKPVEVKKKLKLQLKSRK